jgi:DEAD/DEAH box helicase domain-containing protein
LADIILEETPISEHQTQQTLWNGHKYISFTDSRQGTAKISALINQDKEANWVRSQVFQRLCELTVEEQKNIELPDDVESILADLRQKLAEEKHPYLQKLSFLISLLAINCNSSLSR